MSNRKPDFIAKCMDKVTNEKSKRLGAAWKNENGTITIIMDLGCSIIHGKQITTTLFPNED